MASVAFVESAAQLTGQEALVRRLEDAAAALSPETGLGIASDLAARGELATRMQTAHRMTQSRVDHARSDHDEAAATRRAARRALDAAIEICRVHDREQVAGIERKVVPVKLRDTVS